MTYSQRTVDLHENGDCGFICSLCDTEDREMWSCEVCGLGYWGEPPDACWHGVTACGGCSCPDCSVEARRP